MNLNPLQRDIMAAVLAGRRLIAIRAGWASGKTSGIALALGALNEMRGGGHAGWVMDNYRRAGRVSIPACRDWLEPQGWASTDSGFLWTAPNGGTVRLVNYYTSAGADGSGLEGVNWGPAAIDECQDLPPSALTRVLGRTGRDGQGDRVVIMAGLPVHDAWWERAARDHPQGCVIHATSAANRANLPDGWAEEMRHTVSAARYDAMVNNRPMPPEGQVYSMFVPEEWPGGNLLSDFDPRGRDCWVAADFGVRRPAAALVASCSTRGVDVIVDDVQPDDVSVYEYADAVAARIEHHGMRVARVVGDPAGNQRSAANPQLATQAQLFVQRLGERLGVRLPPMQSTTEPDRRSIASGVTTLGGLFAAADGARRLCVWRPTWERKAPATARTIASCVQGYRYPERGGDEPKKDGMSDHLMDVLRYWAVNLRWVREADRRPGDSAAAWASDLEGLGDVQSFER